MVANCTVTADADVAESVALKVIVAPCGDAMACAFEKLSVGRAAGLADAPPVIAIKAVAATASASAPRTIVPYIACPIPHGPSARIAAWSDGYGTEVLAAVLGDLVRAPRGQPHPVDAEVGDEALQRGGGLLLDDVGERARGAGQRHVDGGHAVTAEGDAVDQAQVDHVDAQFGVHDVAQRLQQVLGVRSLNNFFAHLLPPSRAPPHAGSCSPIACAVASFHAIQASRAHLIRAGYLDTPANATASPSTSSSGSPSPFDCMSARNSSWSFIPSPTGRPITRSLSTDALAWLIEQPSAS